MILQGAVLVAALSLGGLLAGCTGDGQPSTRLSGKPASGPPNSSTASSGTPSVQPASSPSASKTATGLIVFDGDSLTEGFYLSPSQSYPGQLMARLPKWLDHVNVAVSGQTWPDMLADAEEEVDQLYRQGRSLNLLVAWAGANDLAAGYSAQDIFENARLYYEGRRRAGFVVIAVTMYPLEPAELDARYDRVRREYNQMLRAGWRECADALVDVAADERIGDRSPASRQQYFVDAVHLNEAGYSVIADVVLQTLRPLVDSAEP